VLRLTLSLPVFDTNSSVLHPEFVEGISDKPLEGLKLTRP